MISIDTRTLRPGQTFFALKGERVDGHDFLLEAIEKGAKELVVHEGARLPACAGNVRVVRVPDTMAALVERARAWRQQFTCPIVAVTGSIGKTTTKEMIHSILRRTNVFHHVSYKNQNTLLGLCLNILQMRPGCQVAVFEVGISLRGEMEPKVDLLRPTIGVVTRVAHSHMEGLGDLQDIAKEKRKLFHFFTEHNYGIICGDQPLLSDVSYPHPIIRFGEKRNNRVRASKICGREFVLKLYQEKAPVCLHTNHKGYVQNALAASAVAHLLGIPLEEIVAGLESYAGFEGRFEKRSLKGGQGWLINDCYNANPESMRAALVALDELSAKKKIAILGDMLELGDRELFWHRQIGRVLQKTTSIDQVILVGKRAKNVSQTAPSTINIAYASDWREAVKELEKNLSRRLSRRLSGRGTCVLVKGSHAVGLEHLVDRMCE